MKRALRQFLLTSVVLALLCGCGSTHVIMVGAPRAAITPDAVRIYYSPPRHFQRIAIINSSSGPSWAFTTPSQTAQAVTKIKEEAAKLGANGVLMEALGTSSSGNLGIGVGGENVGYGHHGGYAVGGSGAFGGPILHKTAQATAIYVR
jgi:hypothetical protein